MLLGNPQRPCRHAGMEGGGTQGHISIPRNHFNQSISCFVTPFPSCSKPSSDSYLCLVGSSSSLVMCPWLVNGGPHPLPVELGLSPDSPKLPQGWAPFSAVPWRWETLGLGEERLTRGSLGSNIPFPGAARAVGAPSSLFPLSRALGTTSAVQSHCTDPPNSRRV